MAETQIGIWINVRSLISVITLLILFCTLAQIALGADLLVLAFALIASVAGLVGFQLAGAFNIPGWLALFFVLGNAVIAIIAKTFLLQPLESNLYAPLESFVAFATGSTVLLIAIVISLLIPVGKPIFRPIKEPQRLAWLSTSAFVLGTLAWYIDRLFQDPDGSAFGGIAIFWNLVLMGVIARTALVLERTNLRRSIDSKLWVILVACIAMGLIDNSKTKVALPIVAYFSTSLFYRNGFTFRQVWAGILGLVVIAGLVSPMIHAYRALGIQDIPWQKRIELIERGVKDAFVSGRLQRYEDLASAQFRSIHYNYFGDQKGQALLGRYSSIQQIDPVIGNVTRHGTLGGGVLWPAFTRLLPSFVLPDKPGYIESYRILVQLGLIDPVGGKYPTVPLLAQAFAAYGITGLVLIPFFTFVGFQLALKKLGWALYRNVWAIFFFCVFIVVYANQGDLGQYAGAVLRNFPLLAATLWLLARAYPMRVVSDSPARSA